MLDLTYETIKHVNIIAKVILGGLSTHCTNSADYLTWRTFMDGFYRAGGARFDAFAIHPYYANNRPMYAGGVQPLLQPAETKLYLTRTATATPRSGSPSSATDDQAGALTPRKQGERLREALGQVVKWAWVERMFVFAWMDFLID